MKISAASGGAGIGGDANLMTSDGNGAGGSGAIVLKSGTAATESSGSIIITTGSSTGDGGGSANISCGGSSGSEGAPMTVVAGTTTAQASGGGLYLMSGFGPASMTGAVILASRSTESTGHVSVASGVAQESGKAGSVSLGAADALGVVGGVDCTGGGTGAGPGSDVVASIGDVIGTSAIGGAVRILSASDGGVTGSDTTIMAGIGTTVVGDVRATAAGCASAVFATGAGCATGAATVATGDSAQGESANIKLSADLSASGGDTAMVSGSGVGGAGVACLAGAGTTGGSAILGAGSSVGTGSPVCFTSSDSVASGAATAMTGSSTAATGELSFAIGAANYAGTLSLEADTAVGGLGSDISVQAGGGAYASLTTVVSGGATGEVSGATTVATKAGVADVGTIGLTTGVATAGDSGTLAVAAGVSGGSGTLSVAASHDSMSAATGDSCLAAGCGGLTAGTTSMTTSATSATAGVSERIDLVAGTHGEIGLVSLVTSDNENTIGFACSESHNPIFDLRLRYDASAQNTSMLISNADFTTATDIIYSSDRRIKKDVYPADVDDLHRRLIRVGLQTYGYTDNWRSVRSRGASVVRGVVAQELKEIFPEHVTVLPSYSLPDKGFGLHDFHQVDKMSLTLDAIAGLQAQAARYRVGRGGTMTSATLSLHSDDSDETGEISLATGISSSVRSGAVVICSGAANRGVGGGLTLAVGGAGVLGNLKIWAGAGRRALIASANERVSFQGGRGCHHGSFVASAATKSHFRVGPTVNSGAPLLLASSSSSRGVAGCVRLVAGCTAGGPCGGRADLAAGNALNAGGGAAFVGGHGQVSARPIDLSSGLSQAKTGASVVLASALARNESGSVELRTGEAMTSPSGGVGILSGSSKEAAGGGIVLKAGESESGAGVTKIVLGADDILIRGVDQRVNVAAGEGRGAFSQQPTNSRGGHIAIESKHLTGNKEDTTAVAVCTTGDSQLDVSVHSGDASSDDWAGGALVIENMAERGDIQVSARTANSGGVSIGSKSAGVSSGAICVGSGTGKEAGEVGFRAGTSHDADGGIVGIVAGSSQEDSLATGGGVGCVAGAGCQGGGVHKRELGSYSPGVGFHRT